MPESKSISHRQYGHKMTGIFFDEKLVGTINLIEGDYRLTLYKPLFNNSYPTYEAALAAATLIYYSGDKA